ncbi:MAG: glycosyltransferase [Mucilaginibacter sp.]|nr:glycosyltransferase [Mucilaginibacter sp.]
MIDLQIAIVIPAYKVKYLDAALASIAAQTNKNFKVYVCDDGSKEDIKSITDKYSDKINIQYNRFPDNAGRHDLVKHWNRSVELVNEEWVWLFSDDDIMSPGCVQAFFDALPLTKGQHNVYRFNIEMIDADGQVIYKEYPNPGLETGYDFLKRRLQCKCLSAAVEYIFRKDAFVKNGGFIGFPLAYCSDDASWIAFAGDGEICTIPNELIYWRASGINISSTKGFQNQKVDALLKFIEHIIKKYPDKKAELLSLSQGWFFQCLNSIGGHLNPWKMLITLKKLNTIFPGNKNSLRKEMILFRLRHTRLDGKLNKWLKY